MRPVIQCWLKHWMRDQQLRRFIELFAEKVYQDKNQPLQFKFNTVKTSTARSYTLQKEVQVLRQLSCQLYYHLKSIRNIDIREIEVLYVLYQKEAKYMFFATNPLKDEDIFSRIQNEWEQNNLQVITTSPHKPYGEENNTKKKRKERSERHAEDLKRHVVLIPESFDELPESGIYLVKPIIYKNIKNTRRTTVLSSSVNYKSSSQRRLEISNIWQKTAVYLMPGTALLWKTMWYGFIIQWESRVSLGASYYRTRIRGVDINP